MTALPVIVAFGGINAAGRSSFHQGYRRTVLDSLPASEQEKTIAGLACLMNLVSWENDHYVDAEGGTMSEAEVAHEYRQKVLDGTLIRRIEEDSHFDPDNVPCNNLLKLEATGEALKFITKRRSLPPVLPSDWRVVDIEDGKVQVEISGTAEGLVPNTRSIPVKSAGILPTGFEPAKLYNSRYQPRGLQLAIYGASDTVRSMGIDWDTVCNAVHPDEIGVYASSALGQLHDEGWGGVISNRFKGGRPSSKQIPMALNSMPADFLNAYVLGSVGHTESVAGACASFLYNLRSAVDDIRSGRRRVAVVGNSESPMNPEVLEGFTMMGALATEEGLAKIDGTDKPDPRKTSRPFGDNCGFTAGESAQYIILMDDALAVELGADIHGAVPDVFVNADGVKKSISSPGAGNYVSVAKAVAAAKAILGEESIRERSFVQAHGSSTPQNRVTESHIFHEVAEAFGIENWPVAAVKAYVGHSMAPASGDQMISTLGVFRYGLVPGVKTTDKVADDVYDDHLTIPLQDMDVGVGNLDVAFINAKGFGGNNATGVVMSPQVTEQMLQKRHAEQWAEYEARREQTRAAAADYEQQADRCELEPIYRFGEGIINEADIEITSEKMVMPGFAQPVVFDQNNPYGDMR
ncbi:beta-ketoacyl synthase [bacterium SCSIO 12696]|nr:beta-ketoacyl synthase [bacterium SCSIO 12696]